MRLAEFIRSNRPHIIAEWEDFARTLIPVADDKGSLTLRDHIEQILTFVTDDIDSPQTGPEQISKSRGGAIKAPGVPRLYTAAETHADLRLAGGFDLDQMVSEFRALRASIIKLWYAQNKDMNRIDVMDVTRFNEAIDQALTESIAHFTKKLDGAKELFLGILGHDLSNPVSAILGSARLTLQLGPLTDRQTMLVAQIAECSLRVSDVIDHLVDLTRARLGSGLTILKAPMDFDFVSRKLVQEMQATYPERLINLKISGDMEGVGDRARIGQVFSNLIGNAVQYSFVETPINVTVQGNADDITVSVHNQGVPIPRDKVGHVFDSLTRNIANDQGDRYGAINLGLGLYITREIVMAHGGTIRVTSLERSGTTFSANFPKKPVAAVIARPVYPGSPA